MGVTNETRLLSFKDPCHPRDIWNDKMKAGSIYILPFDNCKNIIKELWVKDASKRVEATYSSDVLIKEPDLWQTYRGQGGHSPQGSEKLWKRTLNPRSSRGISNGGWLDRGLLPVTHRDSSIVTLPAEVQCPGATTAVSLEVPMWTQACDKNEVLGFSWYKELLKESVQGPERWLSG